VGRKTPLRLIIKINRNETRKMKQERVKITTVKGRIWTIKISKRTRTHIYGTDKFDDPVIIPINDIESMIPISTQNKQEEKEK
jgi:hypothetical protein